MATIEQDLEDLKIGDTLLLPIQFLDDEDDTPIGQAGNHYTFTLKRDITAADADADLLVDHVVPAGTDANDGVVVFRAEASETAALNPGSYTHEIKQIIPAAPENTVITLFDGKIKLRH